MQGDGAAQMGKGRSAWVELCSAGRANGRMGGRAGANSEEGAQARYCQAEEYRAGTTAR